ncbi:hypothetical protein E1218_21970 [Kribbella turkmenica]|uniref:Uncharacterized protein n=1 Tax=Kribbella turkmenica TaxID=2530375 RepID=A0A4R4WT44_9ACTN|nr:hypothetical protein [Kribbella turkmenica]TDD20771.1 hypothetical protein E1218_21970 [Kribbella turkmenica]
MGHEGFDKPFSDLKTSSRWLAAVVILLSIIGFFAIAHWAPLAPGATSTDFHFGSNTYQALQQLLGAIISIGLISILYEAFLRRTYGRDLRRYLRLKSSMVASGIQDVVPAEQVEWQNVLSDAADVRIILRDPGAWLPANQPWLLASARKRELRLTIAVPDEAGPNFDLVAESCGQKPDELRSNIQAAVSHLTRRWNSEVKDLKKGTNFRVVTYRSLPTYDLVVADEVVVVSIGKAQAEGPIGQQLAFVFDTSPGGGSYPAAWLMDQLKPLDSANSIWESKVK